MNARLSTRRGALLAGGTILLAGAGGALAWRSKATRSADDDITLDELLAAAPEPSLEHVEVPADAERLDTFAGAQFDRAVDDASAALGRASAWSAQTGRAVLVEGVWQLHNPAVLAHAGATLVFDNAELRVRDDGRWINKVPLGLHVAAERVSLLGHCILTGLAEPGKSFLQGVYLDRAIAPILGRFTVRNMAIGLHFMGCDDAVCGFVDAYSMWGLQGWLERPDGAGSAQVVSACRRSRFGGLRSLRNDKAARYLSVGWSATGEPRDNSDNEFGPIEVDTRPGSVWCSAMGVRSSLNSRFAGGIGRNVSYLVILQKYGTDDAYHIDGNTFGDWSGTVVDASGSSVDAALNILVVPEAKTSIGKNSFGRLTASMAQVDPGLIQSWGYRLPTNYGIYANSGDTSLGAVAFDGFTNHVYLEDATLAIATLSSTRMARQPLRCARGSELRIGEYLVLSDTAGPGRDDALIGFSGGGAGGAPRLAIDRIDVRPAMPAGETDYVLDAASSEGSICIGEVLGRMRRGGVRLDGVDQPGSGAGHACMAKIR